MRSLVFFSLFLLQGLLPTYPWRVDHRRENVLQSRENIRANSDVEKSGNRFAKVYGGKNWAEFTNLPPGWEILDFGAPETAHNLRFRQSGTKSRAPGEDDTGTGDLLRCVQSPDGKIHCGPPPPSTNPNHGAETDLNVLKHAVDKLDADIGATDKKETAGKETAGKSNEQLDNKKALILNPGESSPTSKNEPTSKDKTDLEDKKPPTDTKPALDSPKKEPKEPKEPKAPTDKDGLLRGMEKTDATNKKPPPSIFSKPDSDSTTNGFVIGGGYVITLQGNPRRVKNADRIIEDNKELKLQKLTAVTMAETDASRDLADTTRLKDAEIACAKSHIKAIRKVAELGNRPRDALWFIFEDDVQLKPNFLEQVTRNIKSLNRPWDILNTWLMPPRKALKGRPGLLADHLVIPDGYWGMQGYVLTPRSAERLLKCLDPPNHKVWAQVDEMIGCCAASSSSEPYTRCVYRTKVPVEVAADIHVYCMTPALLVHLDQTLGSYAHRRKLRKFWKGANDPLATMANEILHPQQVSIREDLTSPSSNVGIVQNEIHDLEKRMQKQNDFMVL